MRFILITEEDVKACWDTEKKKMYIDNGLGFSEVKGTFQMHMKHFKNPTLKEIDKVPVGLILYEEKKRNAQLGIR